MQARRPLLGLGSVVCCFGLALSSSARAAAPTSTVTVVVTNPREKPVDNATVIIDFLGSHNIAKLGKRKLTHWEMKTNQLGVARFPPVPQGTIQLQIVAKAYQTTGNKYEIDADEKTIPIKLNTPQDQYSAHPPLKPADPPK